MTGPASVSGIELFGFHGVSEEERTIGNRFRIDLQMEGDFQKALKSDCLADTIDYSQVVEVVGETNRERRYFLIESFADAIGDVLLARFAKIRKISVRVAKLAPPGLGEEIACAAIELTKVRA